MLNKITQINKYKLFLLYNMFDIKIGVIIIDCILVIFGVLFWFSDKFAHALGVEGFIKRFLAGVICFIILIIITLISGHK